jgi:hypothetical protein
VPHEHRDAAVCELIRRGKHPPAVVTRDDSQ